MHIMCVRMSTEAGERIGGPGTRAISSGDPPYKSREYNSSALRELQALQLLRHLSRYREKSKYD